jgi:Xaa-Pro dipeptidase
MERDAERIDRLTAALGAANLDALCCRLPHNVLLLTGYWPMLGTAIALLTRDGDLALLVPEDEHLLARHGWVDDARITLFSPSTLDHLGNGNKAARSLLAEAGRRLGLARAAVGYEGQFGFAPVPYVALATGTGTSLDLYKMALPDTDFWDATVLLDEQRATLTARELTAAARACAVAEQAFRAARRAIRLGATEAQVAAAAQTRLEIAGLREPLVQRAGGRAFCMSGPRSADAYRAYALTSDRPLQSGDFVLVHVNSYVDGFWTDLTRTYFLGEPSGRQLALYEAVFEARSRAFRVVGDGVPAAAVDAAARDHLTAAGFGAAFKHQLGHGVGYGAIYHGNQPRLHPCSEDVLHGGMVCNIEPAVYIDGFGGLRHCDDVAVLPTGMQLLSPFHASLADLLIAD